jgi:hypothetical protein
MARGKGEEKSMLERDSIAPQGLLWAKGVRLQEEEGLEGIIEKASSRIPSKLHYPSRTLLMVSGPPAVGKTTMLKRLLPDAFVIELDRYVEQRPGETPPFKFHQDQFILAIGNALGERDSVIVHMTGLRAPLRGGVILTAVYAYGAQAHAIYLDGTPELSREGQMARSAERDYIPDDVMDRYYEEWEYLKLKILAGDLIEEEKLSSVVVLDREAVDSLASIFFDL